MGTRSLTILTGQNDTDEIAVLYRQMDGYPTGHGADLVAFLAGIHLVNGIRSNETRRIANGMDCLAAQVIGHFKDGPGNFYLFKAGTRDAGEEYLYTIYQRDGVIRLRCQQCDSDLSQPLTLFDGEPKDWEPKMQRAS